MNEAKLKELVEICKETNNREKLAYTGLALISNKITAIGIKLGIRPRNIAKHETIASYMKLLNTIIKDNLTISLFEPTFLNDMKLRSWLRFKKECANLKHLPAS